MQYRDKFNDTGVQIETARKLHQTTQKFNVPLLINDRVDVALAVGAEGVHLGQDDMSSLPQVDGRCMILVLTSKPEFQEAKKLLPENSIIGITTSSIEEAQKAISDGADYLGVGTMFATPT